MIETMRGRLALVPFMLGHITDDMPPLGLPPPPDIRVMKALMDKVVAEEAEYADPRMPPPRKFKWSIP